MWKTLVFHGNYYIFQVLIIEEEVIISLSDLQTIWSKKTSRGNLTELFKETNPLLDQDVNDLYKSCQLILKENYIQNLTLDDDTHEFTINFKHFLEELPLKLEINLAKVAGTEFFKNVTIPIIQTLQYLEFKQRKLEGLLAQKDKELLEYKLEYGKITRKMLETDKYESDMSEKSNLLLNIFSTDEIFYKVFSERHGDVQQFFAEIYEKKAEKRKLELAPSRNTRPSLRRNLATCGETMANTTHVPGEYSVAYVTVPDEALAKKLAKGLVSQRLAACVNIIPQLTSIYEWKGEIQEDKELLLMIKTRTSRVKELTDYVRVNHSYEVCEVISLPIESGNPAYLKWLGEIVLEKGAN